MKKLLIAIVLIVLIPVLVLGYLGFMPGVSKVMGSDTPRDLGVKATAEDQKAVLAKIGSERISLPAGTVDFLKYEGKKPLSAGFDSTELTARINACEDFRYIAVRDVQLRINPDSTTEISGRLDLDMVGMRFDQVAAEYSVPEDVKGQGKEMLDKVMRMNDDPPFYVKGNLVIKENKVNLDIKDAEVGRMPLPLDRLPAGTEDRFAEQILSRVPGLDVKSLEMRDGKMYFDGTIPDKIYREVSP